MTDQPENIIVRQLQEMRTENAAQFGEIRVQIGYLAKRQVDIRTGLKKISSEIKDVRGQMDRMNTHMHEIAITIDHHCDRLDRIERHLGLDKSKH